MTIKELRLLYELIDLDLASPEYYMPKDEAFVLIEPLLQQFLCAASNRKTLADAAKDITYLRLRAATFEDFYVTALDLLLTKRPISMY